MNLDLRKKFLAFSLIFGIALQLFSTVSWALSLASSTEPTPNQDMLNAIRFKSSLNEGGVNLVLFDPEVCKAVSSDLVNVKSIKIGTKLPWIYQM